MNEPAAVPPLPDVRAGPHDHQRQGRLKLAVGAIGIVFGDIGTSPIYAFREAVVAATGEAVVAPDTTVAAGDTVEIIVLRELP